MKMIPYYVLTPEEYFTVRRVKHLLGYTLEGEERDAEVRAAGLLFRKNDPFRADQYEAAYDALVALRKRLSEQTNPEHWEEHTRFMAEERRVQVMLLDEAIEALTIPARLPTELAFEDMR
jgi:hypothetical protein